MSVNANNAYDGAANTAKAMARASGVAGIDARYDQMMATGVNDTATIALSMTMIVANVQTIRHHAVPGGLR
jgi:hypothetical protein